MYIITFFIVTNSRGTDFPVFGYAIFIRAPRSSPVASFVISLYFSTCKGFLHLSRFHTVDYCNVFQTSIDRDENDQLCRLEHIIFFIYANLSLGSSRTTFVRARLVAMAIKTCFVFCILSGILFTDQSKVTSFSPTSQNAFGSRRIHGNRCKCLFSWQDKLKEFFSFEDESQFGEQDQKQFVQKTATGTVVRLAARKYDPSSSKPSSRKYTTRKDEFSSVQITKEGVEGDYNHYRTVALKSTEDRAVSILTLDVMNSIRATYKNYNIQQGDLGENVLVEGVPFSFFQIGRRYVFKSPDSDDESSLDGAKESVVVEITEPMEPCANLCKLSYINDQSIEPSKRIDRCKDFIEYLGRFDGYRGWYAKVHTQGVIKHGALVSLVEEED